MNMWRRFRLLSLAKQIGLTVLFFHAVLVTFILLDHTLRKSRQFPTKIAIRTFSPSIISTAPPKTIPVTGNASPQKAANTKKQGNVKKPTVSKKETPSKILKKRGESPVERKERISHEQTALLQEMAENLEILSSSTEIQTPRRKLNLPSSIPKRISVDDEIQLDPSYGAALGAYLQEALDLPEYGEVKVKLTIDAAGTLLTMEILETRNKKNSEFLKKRLPELSFPCFNDFGILDTVHNFTITFTNVEDH